MLPTTILIIILIIIGFEFFLNRILDFLNLNNQEATLPEGLREIYDETKYNKSLSYHLAQTNFSFLTSGFGLLVSCLMLGFGGFGALDEYLRQSITNEIGLALAFFGILFIVSDILNIPFQLYDTFVIEEKYGFNKTTISTFIADKFKSYLLTAVFGGLVLAILLTLLKFLGPSFWYYFWLFISIIILIVNMFYASLILPLFNKLTPLQDGELKNAIQAYATKVEFPLDNVYVIDGSKRSAKANAFFSGLGKKKKIVLYDTLIQNHTIEELVAILAHEVGHFKKKHIISGMALSIFQMGITLFIMSFIIFNEKLSYALGSSFNSLHINMIAFALLYSPISMLSGIFMNIVSRKNEFEADNYAVSTYAGNPLIAALKKLSVDNLSILTPHPAYVFFHYSHPPLLNRLSAMRQSIRVKQKRN